MSAYVKGVPLGRRITIRMLLNHTSGIHDYRLPLQRKFFSRGHRNWRPRQIIRRDLRRPRYCRPGGCWVYSNTNYLLLGEVIRKVTQQRLRRLYERRIFDRLGLGDTSFRPRRPTPRPAVHGYIHGPRDVTDWNFSWAWTAGGASSTLADLRRWAPRLATGRGILPPRMQRKRLRTVPEGNGDRYGLGIEELLGEGPLATLGSFFGHTGSAPGYDSLAYYSPSAKLTVVGLGNTSVGADPVIRTPQGATFATLLKQILPVFAPM